MHLYSTLCERQTCSHKICLFPLPFLFLFCSNLWHFIVYLTSALPRKLEGRYLIHDSICWVLADTCNSWKRSGDMVAVYRKPEMVILLLPPHHSCNTKSRKLMCSFTLSLCYLQFRLCSVMDTKYSWNCCL